jgi:hypothetical protein
LVVGFGLADELDLAVVVVKKVARPTGRLEPMFHVGDSANLSHLLPSFDSALQTLGASLSRSLLSMQRVLLVDGVSKHNCAGFVVHHCNARFLVGMEISHKDDLCPSSLPGIGSACKIDKVGWLFTFTGAAYNLCRLRNLMARA